MGYREAVVKNDEYRRGSMSIVGDTLPEEWIIDRLATSGGSTVAVVFDSVQ